MRSKKQEWEAERKVLVAEKRKLEYDIYDLLQVNFASRTNFIESELFVPREECVGDAV
jgi:hypothetical protein